MSYRRPMNILTDNFVPLQSNEGGPVLHASLEGVWLGEYPQYQLAAASPLQYLSYIHLLTNLTATLMEDNCPRGGDPSFSSLAPEQIKGWVSEQAPHFNLFGDTRFMQVSFAEGEGTSRTDVRELLVADIPGSRTGHQFNRAAALVDSAYCPHCAGIDLFSFHQYTPGAGKASSGVHLHGLNTIIPAPDVLSLILANTVPWCTRNRELFRGNMTLLGDRKSPPDFPWVAPLYQEQLREGTALNPNSPLINMKYFRFWMPRQVWLECEELHEAKPCIACGQPTTLHISSIREGKGKGKTAKTQGAIKLPPGDYFSHLKPVRVVKGKGKNDPPRDRPLLATSLRQLLGVSSQLLRGVAGTQPAPVVAMSLKEELDIPSLKVLSIFTENGAFKSALHAELPVTQDTEDMADMLQEMADSAQTQRKNIYSALAIFFQPGKIKPTPMRVALDAFDTFIGTFTEHLLDPSQDSAACLGNWNRALYRESKSLYESAVGSDLHGNRTDKEGKAVPKMQLFSKGLRALSKKPS